MWPQPTVKASVALPLKTMATGAEPGGKFRRKNRGHCEWMFPRPAPPSSNYLAINLFGRRQLHHIQIEPDGIVGKFFVTDELQGIIQRALRIVRRRAQ